MTGRRPTPAWSPEVLATTWQSASLLLGYPDDHLVADLPLLRSAVRALPRDMGAPLHSVIDHLSGTPRSELETAYVETFDNQRRCSLYLTYFTEGDTRRRGVALLRFTQTYLRSGQRLDAEELPDHLCVVLEYAACVDPTLGWGLLLDHRVGIELLWMALRDLRSPWVGAVAAVRATLPGLRGDDEGRLRRLLAEGPPAEAVGLVAPMGGPVW